MKLIAQQGDRVFLLGVGEDMARVLDLDQGTLFPPFNVHSILARGYWENPVIGIEDVLPLMQGVRFVDWGKEPNERDDVRVINRNTGDTMLDIINSHSHVKVVQHFDRPLFERLLSVSSEDSRTFCEEMEHWGELVPENVVHRENTFGSEDGRDYLEALVTTQPSMVVEYRWASEG